MVRVGAQRVAGLLRGRLGALRLERGRGRVSVALELVAQVLSRRLLRVGLFAAVSITVTRYAEAAMLDDEP